MITKKLFVLISDGGDGSYSANYTFNEDFVNALAAKDNSESGELGTDGDGFHYDTLTVPDTCTLESLGITSDAAVDHAELLNVQEDA
jgi:hypothetical protein